MTRFVVGNLFLLTSMLCAATSQIILKGVLREVEPLGLSWDAWQPMLAPDRLLRSGVAMLLIGIGFVSWVMCLARLELSYAYPFMSLAFALVLLLSAVFFREQITTSKLLGILLIIAGITVGTRG